MIDCKDLIHPFKDDPGVSQANRIDPELLTSKTAIDNRSLADLLDFFVQLSRHVQYYDEELKISDWQGFFASSLPFNLAAIAKYNSKQADEKFLTYITRFLKKPSKAGLYLLLRSIFLLFKKIDKWYVQMADQHTALEPLMEKMIKDKLGTTLKLFISYANVSTNKFGTKALDFSSFASSPVWMLTSTDLAKEDTTYLLAGNTFYKKLKGLYNNIYKLIQTIHDSVKLFSVSAEMSLSASLVPLQQELQEKHPPHLAIIFAFIKLFGYLQNDLNGFSKKHLDFFYKEVLQLKPKPGQADHAYLVIEIQDQLSKYLLKKGLSFKDGKDANKIDIIFTSNEEILINTAKVKEQRTLFLQNGPIRYAPVRRICETYSVVEGVYMAPDATMANGLDKAFEEVTSRETLGAKWSKYQDPENKFIFPYPNARLGFVLASPVLYLQEGQRRIRITMDCRVVNNFCATQRPIRTPGNPCCDEAAAQPSPSTANTCTEAFPSVALFEQVQETLKSSFYYINRQIIATLAKKGINAELRGKLDALLVINFKSPGKGNPGRGDIIDPDICYCGREEYLFEITLTEGEFFSRFTAAEFDLIKELIYPRKAFNVLFSGEKGWVKPEDHNLNISLANFDPNTGSFTMDIVSNIEPEQDKITFYNPDVLEEILNTELPLVKIELDDKIKIKIPSDGCRSVPSCCERPFVSKTQLVSLYHFFRDVKVNRDTKIEVDVCGLKNFVVQNDESLQDINTPVYPFGTRPEVIDFDIKIDLPPLNALGDLNLIGPNFYLGSKEMLLKQWDRVYINIDWKDLPSDFKNYYHGYLIEGLDINRFLINIAVLEDGRWKKELLHGSPVTTPITITGQVYNDRRLFTDDNISQCKHEPETQIIFLKKEFFSLSQRFKINKDKLDRYDVNTRDGFIRINLQVQDFCHKVYSYVLARQMMALGKLPDAKIEDAVYYDPSTGLIVFSTEDILNDVIASRDLADYVRKEINDPNKIADQAGVVGSISQSRADIIRKILANAPAGENLQMEVINLLNSINGVGNLISNSDKFQAVIPNEPWTPIMKSISVDYSATAAAKDIDLIHLYPYAGCFKTEELEQGAMLFPTICDEGNLFIGLESLTPGANLSLLMQFAEATADSESEREEPVWYYLENNQWKLMRAGFEVLYDETNGLTTSGIVQFSIPGNISKNNTVMPGQLHWLRVSMPCKTDAVSELLELRAQAVKVSFTNAEENDKLRLNKALPAGSISRLLDADSSVSSINQLYESFGGRQPEGEGHYYTRVSELLRHKNRGIQKFDYERIVLEHFPSLYKAKCINHTYGLSANTYINDYTIAPGYVLVAVIPDMNILKAAGSFEPKVPLSILEAVQGKLRTVTSPFVRLKVMNPRYEKVNLCIRVKLQAGKDHVYYKEQLQMDIRNFLAPWAVGEYDKLSFGQPVYRSDIIHFLETRDYIDFIIDLHMAHEYWNLPTGSAAAQVTLVPTLSARSILIAGSVDVCIDDPGCETWCKCRAEDCCNHKVIPVRETEPIIIL